jgi:hypothetical protein
MRSFWTLLGDVYLRKISQRPSVVGKKLHQAAGELGAIARGCQMLALKTGDNDLINGAEAGLAMVAGVEERLDQPESGSSYVFIE